MRDTIYEVLTSFRTIHHALFSLVRKHAEAAGLSTVEALSLLILSKSANIGVTELAEQLETSASTISNTAERLVQMGYVDRVRLDTDRRQVSLTLTESGRAAVNHVFGAGSPLRRHYAGFQQIPAAELEALLATHRKVLQIIQVGED